MSFALAGARKADLYWESELEALRKRAGALETEPRLSEAQKQAIRGLGMEGNPVVRLRPNGDVEARTSRGDGRRVKYLITPAGETAMTTSLPPIRSMTLSAVLGAVGDSIRRLASPLAPPWFLGHVSLPAEPVRAEFDGFFKRVYVTDHWVVVHGAWGYSKIRLADIADLRSGFDPSPHDEGPVRGIWIKAISGEEFEAGIFKPEEAASLINSLRVTVRRRWNSPSKPL